MKDYFDGWEDRENMQIPEREKEGFQEKVIVRKPVVPIREKKQPEEEIYTGDAPTVLLSPDMKVQAYIKRVSTGEETPVDKDGFVIGKSVEADFVVKKGLKGLKKKRAVIVPGFCMKSFNILCKIIPHKILLAVFK